MTQEEILERIRYHCELRGLSKWTMQGYYQDSKRFQNHCGKPASELGLTDIQDYLIYQRNERGNRSGTINRVMSSMRFLYGVVLEIPLDFSKLPSHRNYRSFPEIMMREEVESLFAACDNLRDKTIFMTTYGVGLRVSEVANLTVSSIDSANMQILIRNGKGGKDRYALLSQANLDVLREYWLAYRPKNYLFLSRNHRPMSVRSIQDALGTRAEADWQRCLRLPLLWIAAARTLFTPDEDSYDTLLEGELCYAFFSIFAASFHCRCCSCDIHIQRITHFQPIWNHSFPIVSASTSAVSCYQH